MSCACTLHLLFVCALFCMFGCVVYLNVCACTASSCHLVEGVC